MTENKRVIKFRGLDVNARTWVYGHYIEGSHGHYIGKPETGERWQIMPDSVGQFTGLTDKNGVDIYEGDVIKGELIYPSSETGTLPTMGAVEYCEGYSAFGLKNDAGVTLFHNHLIHSFEVIGNIYQNPDLLTSK